MAKRKTRKSLYVLQCKFNFLDGNFSLATLHSLIPLSSELNLKIDVLGIEEFGNLFNDLENMRNFSMTTGRIETYTLK